MDARPCVVVSKCLEFAACRYDGERITCSVVTDLKPLVDFIPLCPEVAIGLGVPRSPIRIVEVEGMRHLYQAKTEQYHTEAMESYAKQALDALPAIDGCILKSRSPSCGVKDVKLFGSLAEKAQTIGKTDGFFGHEVKKRYGHLAIEDDGRLKNFTIREHFYTQLFVFARFRTVKQDQTMKSLVQFQAENKFLFMAYNQSKQKVLGQIVANRDTLSLHDILAKYEVTLGQVFAKTPRYNSNINVLLHCLGYFTKELSAKEKGFFLESLNQYRLQKVPLSVPVAILKSFVVRFDQDYLAKQTFFSPYPEELVSITDSGKGRDT